MSTRHRPQDAYRIRGHWHCRTCNTGGKGGHREFYTHWMSEHYQPPKEQS